MRRFSFGRWCLLGAAVVGASAGGCGSDNEGKACEEGTEACPCYPNHTCNGELSCLSDYCVDASGSTEGGASSATGGSSSTGSSGKSGTGGTGGKSTGAGGTSSGTGGKSTGAGGSTTSSGGTSAGAGGSGAVSHASTPVELHGQLAVSGANLLDASGAAVKLEGMSSMWLNWDTAGYATSKAGLTWMRDNWNLRVFRAAMGVAPPGAPTLGYLADPATAKAQVNQIVQNAIDLGVYVIIDWHDHDALLHQTEALAFFREMSTKWGSTPNVIYEVFNEPLDLDWGTQLKPYHQALVAAIREKDPDNVILLGTPNWDQDVDIAAQSPLSGKNLMYTLHFYACTHKAPQRNKAMTARSLGLPMFVSEWGATHADGGVDGVVCETEARTWHDWLDASNISWTAWKLDGCKDSSCMFKNQTAPADGGWTAAQLNGHAQIVIDEMKNGSGMGTGGTSGTGGSSGTGGALGTGGGSSVGNFPPDPAGCALLSSCTSCCSTTGVFALDTASMDLTAQGVTAFTVSATQASASFRFTAANQIGAIFFKLSGAEDIGSLGLTMGGSGGSFEVALVQGGGANGCFYAVVGGEIDPFALDCWGLGAGPAVARPVDQIEVRVRSVSSGTASLSVSDLQFGP